MYPIIAFPTKGCHALDAMPPKQDGGQAILMAWCVIPTAASEIVKPYRFFSRPFKFHPSLLSLPLKAWKKIMLD